MAFLTVLDILMMVLGGAGLVYQGVCVAMSLFSKPVRFPDAPMDRRYAVLISARNERNVIGNLIDSIRAQTYPSALIDIWLVADNCTDDTADVVRAKGCHVIERHNTEQIGKGYALTYLLGRMIDMGVSDDYDAYFVFDADNKLDRHYFEEMNKAFQSGFRILTSYRNSVNLADNWVSSGSALWFIRESRFLNNSRMLFGSSCHVGGTGFMFSREVMKRNKGWKFHLLTEDLEFTMDSVLHGDRIGYCGTAILYDEQPVTFKQSWRQRLRWSKGFLQVFRYYGPSLIRRAVRERDFSAVDFTLLLCPFTVLAGVRLVIGYLFAAFGFVTWMSQVQTMVNWVSGIVTGMLVMMGLVALTIVVERDRIGATNKELVAYVLSFPIYMLSYVPISFQAVFSKAQWKPIAHKGA
ncbi:glycosyltransferase family 2 protein [Bifidobacterium jacchi]|uniref:Glycosyltransferase n=1 Tax=Bifidobacterium jacchi TaxID=2490545 RepID=A0A5N5RIQ7_9BIFI|nr:glycosyltransferase family 2 protein [Bifidobacterium jacchi]KAB5607165.1 glycosyltransferase [Bifidobacterium jacchi]